MTSHPLEEAFLRSFGEPYCMKWTGAMPGLQAFKRPTLRLDFRVSSLGTLEENLPDEIVLVILGLLNVESLAQFSLTCFKGKAFVEGLPAYKAMMKYMTGTMVALREVGRLNYHSVDAYHQALRCDKCSACGTELAGYLFLPTCQRTCWNCLKVNTAFMLMRLSEANTCFGLTEVQLERLPKYADEVDYQELGLVGAAYFSLPHGECQFYPPGQDLVSVIQAKQLALAIHGSTKALDENVPKIQLPDTLTLEKLNLENLRRSYTHEWQKACLRKYQDSPLVPRDFEPNWLDEVFDWPMSETVVIRFPFLTAGQTGRDFGYQCKSCMFHMKKVNPWASKFSVIYSRAQLLEHVKLGPDGCKDSQGYLERWLVKHSGKRP